MTFRCELGGVRRIWWKQSAASNTTQVTGRRHKWRFLVKTSHILSLLSTQDVQLKWQCFSYVSAAWGGLLHSKHSRKLSEWTFRWVAQIWLNNKCESEASLTNVVYDYVNREHKYIHLLSSSSPDVTLWLNRLNVWLSVFEKHWEVHRSLCCWKVNIL